MCTRIRPGSPAHRTGSSALRGCSKLSVRTGARKTVRVFTKRYQGHTGFSSTVLYGSMLCMERLTHDYWNPLGLNLTGLGTVTQQNMDQFQPILDELMIKHNAGMYTSPECGV